MIKLDKLSTPPSVNNYWGVNGKRRYVKKEGLTFRKEIFYLFKETKKNKINGAVSLTVDVYRKDKRIFDIDNILKCLCDSMKHAGVYDDDSQIERILINKRYGSKSNYIDIKVCNLFGAAGDHKKGPSKKQRRQEMIENGYLITEIVNMGY